MFKKIVVPLDGSKRAEEALASAVDMVKTYDGQLLLLRVCDLPVGMLDYCGQEYYELQAQAQKNAQAYLEKVRESLGVEQAVLTKILIGHVSDSLLVATQDFQADLVVMSSHGKSGLDRWVLGSVTENFARRSTTPVLVVRSGEKFEVPLGQKVLVPLDGSELAESILPLAMAMSKRAKGEVVLLRSHTQNVPTKFEFAGHDLYPDVEQTPSPKSGPQIAQQYLADKLEELQENFANSKVSSRFSVDYVPQAILQTAEEENVDLIAMTSHGATGVAKWIFGSVAEKILRQAKCPILLFKCE